MQHPTRLLIAFLVAAAASPLSAQERHPVSVDATIGGGYGRGGGERVNRNAMAIDGLLGWRARATSGGALLVGLNGGWQGILGSDAVCQPTRSGGCAPDYPSLSSVGALAGREWVARRIVRGASVRALAGAAFYRGEGAGTAGLQGRIDLATPPLFNMALVASARGALLPRFRGERLTLSAVGVGLRVR